MPALYRITKPSPETTGTPSAFQSYLDRLMKMIPAEVVGLYLVGKGIIPANQHIALYIWVLIALIAVIVVRIYGTNDPTKQNPIDWPLVVISSVSFLIWVYTIGGLPDPIGTFNSDHSYVGSLLVLVWTFFVPIFYHGAD